MIDELIDKAIRIATGREGLSLTGEYEEDERYIYPERMGQIIRVLEQIKKEIGDERQTQAADRIKDLEKVLKVIVDAHEMGCVDWPAMRRAKELLEY